MNSLSPTKQKQLAGLAVGAVLFVALSWFFLIRTQQKTLGVQSLKVDEVHQKIETAKNNNRMLDRFVSDFNSSKAELELLETHMPSGDVYRWIVHAFEEIQSTNRVTIWNIDPPRFGESEIPPAVPYRTAIVNVTGLGYYHDIGAFLACMENSLPFMRLQKLELKRATLADTGSEEREQLSFALELLTLVKMDPIEP